MEYLYGMSIQGIQEYIYSTNKLQEIVGASEIIDSLGQKNKDKKKDDGPLFAIFDELKESGLIKEILLNAAGNFRAIVNGKENLSKIVLELPKKIMQNAYGITVSQAAVKYDGYKESSKKLEENLKIQRNRPTLPLDMSINFMLLAPKTARGVVKFSDDRLDISCVQKRKSHDRWFNKRRTEHNEEDDIKFAELKEFSDISNKKHKLAVIHADGNGLGVLVKNLAQIVDSIGKTEAIVNFSEALDRSTKSTFANAKKRTKETFGDSLKIKALILSGDDMTAVCDADIALEFTKNFIEEFENATEREKVLYRAKTNNVCWHSILQ